MPDEQLLAQQPTGIPFPCRNQIQFFLTGIAEEPSCGQGCLQRHGGVGFDFSNYK